MVTKAPATVGPFGTVVGATRRATQTIVANEFTNSAFVKGPTNQNFQQNGFGFFDKATNDYRARLLT